MGLQYFDSYKLNFSLGTIPFKELSIIIKYDNNKIRPTTENNSLNKAYRTPK